MSIAWPPDESTPDVIELEASGFPPTRHAAEADLFCRQAAMPHHCQDRLDRAHVLVVGCGGLGSWTALALARMGVSRLTLVDPDRFDRSNVPRQLVLADGVGQPKAHALARALVPHMTNAGRIVAIARAFDPDTTLSWEMDAIAIGVDNNAARLYAADYAAKHKIPAAFAMLSQDGLRARIFLQTPEGPCLSCVLPDLDVGGAAPCAAAAITSCWLAASHAVAMLVDAIMSEGASRLPIWYEASLDGSTDRAARPKPNGDCGCHAERHLATT